MAGVIRHGWSSLCSALLPWFFAAKLIHLDAVHPYPHNNASCMMMMIIMALFKISEGFKFFRARYDKVNIFLLLLLLFLLR